MGSKLVVETKSFQNLISKAMKATSVSEEAEVTQTLCIDLKDNLLTVKATDGRNYFYCYSNKVQGDDFYAVVPIDKFPKLIERTTTKNISLEIKNDRKASYLEVVGNGKNKIDLSYDIDGLMVKFPDPIAELSRASNTDDWFDGEIKYQTVKMLYNTARASVLQSKDTSVPYTGYYIGDSIMTTDTYKICVINDSLFGGSPVLLHGTTLGLLALFTEEAITVTHTNDKIVFSTGNEAVYSTLMDNVDQYPIDALNARVEAPFEAQCVVDRKLLYYAIERTKLFIELVDDNRLTFTFTKDGIEVSTIDNINHEMVPFVDNQSFMDYVCSFDANMVSDVLKAYRSAKIAICYGRDDILKFREGIICTVIPLAQEDEDDDFDEDDED